MKQVINSYKGFNQNLQCRDFQYEIGKTYEHQGTVKTYEHQGTVKTCGPGFHVFGYCAPANGEFVEAED